MIAGGEGPSAEFKIQLPKTNEERRKLAATVAAFANGHGGTVVYGVDNKTLTTRNLEINQDALDALEHIVRDRLEPQPPVLIEAVQVHGDTVVAVSVEKGPLPPYGINPDALDIYVRRGANTVPAHREEIVSLCTASVGPGRSWSS
jgi:predicted HTH transcriptional regulator